MASSSSRASSTFWLIDTTSVSGTFTTTATFTLWVPLDTTSSSPTPTQSESAPAESNTGVIVGSVVGSLLALALVTVLFVLYWRRTRIRPVRPRTKVDTPQGSTHRLVDLAAEPGPHPDNIEPWIAPAVVRRPTKALEARTQGLSMPTSASPLVESTPDSTSHGHDPVAGPSQHPSALRLHDPAPKSAPQRRRTREPSPPRLEQDAGVSLMRAGDDALPPSYGDLVHDRVPR